MDRNLARTFLSKFNSGVSSVTDRGAFQVTKIANAVVKCRLTNNT
jgi:hypothetical protein